MKQRKPADEKRKRTNCEANHLYRIIDRQKKRLITNFVILIHFSSTPAAASHGSLPCEVPSNLEPLFDLLHSTTQIAFLAGIVLATLGFLSAGILLMLPGEDSTRRGKQVAKQTLFGTILLLSSSMIVSFLTNEMGSTICT